MSEEKKDAYEVGIPLDELPPEELAVNEDAEALPLDGASDESNDPAHLPDLFAPEELAEVGLTAELADNLKNETDDDQLASAGGEEGHPTDHPMEIAPAPEKDLTDDGLGAKIPLVEGTEADTDLEDQSPPAPVDEPSGGGEAAEAQPIALPDDEPVSEEDESVSPAVVAGEDHDSTLPTADSFLDQDLLAGRLESLSLQIGELQREFEGKLKYDAHKDEIIDRLHSELQEYKQDIIKKYVLSIVMDVVKVADDIRKWLAYFRSLEVSQRDPRKLFRYLEAIPSDLEDVFYWHGVKPFSSQEGSFDPARQRAIKKVPTDDPALDKNVAHSIRPGYEWETKVIRQEMVAVYVYQAEQESLDTRIIDE